MTSCQRTWEVEAARDGRLAGKALESHEAHRRSCPSCAHDSKVLADLANGLRTMAFAGADEVAIRRLRNRVLGAFDEARRDPPSSGFRHARLAALLGALAIVVAGLLVLTPRRTAQPTVSGTPAVAAAQAPVDVMPSAGARFTRVMEGNVDRFELQEGTLRLRVRHTAATTRRVLVTTPDGEIEDIGTVFEVTVTSGHTERVGVEEGRVLLSLTGGRALAIDAGGAWNRPIAEAPLPAAAAPPAREVASASARPRASARPSPGVRSEDEAYLHVLQLLEQGHEREARSAAAEYLHDFPAGFRHEEMRRVARGP